MTPGGPPRPYRGLVPYHSARRWLPAPSDAVLCALTVWVALRSQPSAGIWTQVETTPGWVVVVCLGAAGLLVRSRLPRVCLGLLTACLSLHLVLYTDLSLLSALVGLTGAWTAQSRLAGALRPVATAGVYLAAAIGLARSVTAQSPVVWGRTEIGVIAVVMWSLLTVASLGGASRRRARQRVADALDRAEMVRQAAVAQQRAAVAAERTRIARDVHDLLGHSLAVIGMQAAGAQAVVGADTQAVRKALEVIGQTARHSSQEVRDLVDLLHDDAEPVGPCGPPHQGASGPGCAARLDELVCLVDSFRQAGTRVSLRLECRAAADQAAVTVLTMVLREALTNAARHAPAQEVDVRLDLLARTSVLTVVNSLPRAPSDPPRRSGTGTSSMRSRLGDVGGSFQSGPQEGRWVLRAVVPREAS